LNEIKLSTLLVALVLSSLFIPITSAVEGDLTPVGWELLDNNAVLRMWNTRDSYYFNVSSGIQFSNHYQEYWSHNVLGIGYYVGGQWNVLYWTDSLEGFNRDIQTDWETYVNGTLWKDLTSWVGGSSYDYRLAIRYHLKPEDAMLTIQPYIKNLGQPISVDIGFAWRLKEVQVANTLDNDKFRIWEDVGNNSITLDTFYLNQTIDKTYSNTNTTGFIIDDFVAKEYLKMGWSHKLKSKLLVKVKSQQNQFNAPITIFLNVGTLTSGQEKTTIFLWKDATQINDCDSTTDWTGTKCTPAIDEADKQEGTGSIYGTSIDTTTTYYQLKYNPSGTWDFSSYDVLKVWAKLENLVGSCIIRFYTSAGNYYQGSIEPSSAETWEEKTLNLWTDFSTSGSPDETSIDWILIQKGKAVDTAPYMKIDDIRIDVTGGVAYTADLSQSVSSSWNLLAKSDFNIIPTQAIGTTWTVLNQWDAIVIPSQTLTTTWNILIQSTFEVIPTQAIATTWNVLIQSSFNIIPSLSLTSSWVIDILLTHGIQYIVDLSQSITTSWAVDIYEGIPYSVDLTLSIVTSWVIEIVHTEITYATQGFVLASGFLLLFVGLPILFTFILLGRRRR